MSQRPTIEEAARQFHEDNKAQEWFISVGFGKDSVHVYYRYKRGQVTFVMTTCPYPIEWHRVTGKVKALAKEPTP